VNIAAPGAVETSVVFFVMNPTLGAGGRRFESSRPDHFSSSEVTPGLLPAPASIFATAFVPSLSAINQAAHGDHQVVPRSQEPLRDFKG
jgi:hypothetical protein